MNYTFSELKNISINFNNYNLNPIDTDNKLMYNTKLMHNTNENFSRPLVSAALGYVNAKLPYASIRNIGKARTLAKAYGGRILARNIKSLVNKGNKKSNLALNMLINMRYDNLVDNIRQEGKSKGLRGGELRSYIRRTLKSRNLRRFG